MGFSVQTFNLSIGDPGVTQSNAGGNAAVSISASLTPRFGNTIINVPNVQSPIGGTATSVPQPNTNTNDWAYSDNFTTPASYPISTGTVVVTVTAIVAN